MIAARALIKRRVVGKAHHLVRVGVVRALADEMGLCHEVGVEKLSQFTVKLVQLALRVEASDHVD